MTAVAMTDEEVFGMAIHYYDEDDIKVSKMPEMCIRDSNIVLFFGVMVKGIFRR